MKLNVADRSFLSHLCQYVGVGLISGSIVHAATLNGSHLRYGILIGLGVVVFIGGTLLDEKMVRDRSVINYVAISVLVSIGIGMVSGGTQHYLDGPLYAAILLPLGLLVAYLAFIFRDHRQTLSLKRMMMALLVCSVLFGALYSIAHYLPESHHDDQHEEEEY